MNATKWNSKRSLKLLKIRASVQQPSKELGPMKIPCLQATGQFLPAKPLDQIGRNEDAEIVDAVRTPLEVPIWVHKTAFS